MGVQEIQDLSFLKARWPSAIVARSQVGEFTGGMVSPGTLANADSKKNGPDEKVRVGPKVGYPVDSLIRWLQNRTCDFGSMKADMQRKRAARRGR